MELRGYQKAAIRAIQAGFREGLTRLLIKAATGAGKSVIIAECIRLYQQNNPGKRVLILSVTKEILAQNERAVIAVCRASGFEIETGVFCAGLGRKELGAPVVFASRDSMIGVIDNLGNFDFLIIDEAHQVNLLGDSTYKTLVTLIQPTHILGFTATPWRLDNGVIYGQGKDWERLVYDIRADTLQELGFLAPLTIPPSRDLIDSQSIGLSGGDLATREQNKRATDSVIAESLDVWEQEAPDRNLSLFFCCSIAHADRVTRELRNRGIETAYLDGATRQKDRDQIIHDAKLGAYKAVVNVAVLTTGIDIPLIDCVVLLRATQSAALFCQIVGRGLRVHPDKTDCLLLDFAGNLSRFVSIDEPFILDKAPPKTDEFEREETGEGGEKECPECKIMIPQSSRVCIHCGHLFLSHTSQVERSRSTKNWFKVERYNYHFGKTKKGSRCLIVDWTCEGIGTFRQWIMLEGYHPRMSQYYVKMKNGVLSDKIRSINITDLDKPIKKVQHISSKELLHVDDGTQTRTG